MKPENNGDRRAFLLGFLLVSAWVNVSEVFRYFVFVMPLTRAAFRQLENVAPMNVNVFLIWGIWDMILCFSICVYVFLYFDRFGHGFRQVLAAGTLVWLTVFCIFWLGTYNMNLTTPTIPLVALPLAWIEMVVSAWIVAWTRSRQSTDSRGNGATTKVEQTMPATVT